MTLQEYADMFEVSYRTAWQHFKDGKIPKAYKVGKKVIVPDNIVELLQDIYEKEYHR